MRAKIRQRVVLFLVVVCSLSIVDSFQHYPSIAVRRLFDRPSNTISTQSARFGDDIENDVPSPTGCFRDLSDRRKILQSLLLVSTSLVAPGPVLAEGDPVMAVSTSAPPPPSVYKPAIRPTAYRVDSTIPPTLLPLKNAGKQKQMLEALGRGSGTEKDAIVVDTVNLNNMLNKAVFGTIDAVSSITSTNKEETRSGPGYASFVCLGVPAKTSPMDVELASSLVTTLLQPRIKKSSSTPGSTALGLSFCPYSTQPILDAYIQGSSGNEEEETIVTDLNKAGLSEETIRLYLPLLRMAKANHVNLLALSPELEDLRVARSQGLQAVNPEQRLAYVADPQGFVALTSDPKFKLYTDRSLFKDFEPINSRDTGGNFFAERILVHEAAATAVAAYAANRPDSLVALVAPIPDLRFMGGMNGRIPRVCQALNPSSKVTNDAVTTVLLNPTAEETLSRTRYLRLEIGTGPDTLAYQTKVADYLWFSASPKVNLLPRLMEA